MSIIAPTSEVWLKDDGSAFAEAELVYVSSTAIGRVDIHLPEASPKRLGLSRKIIVGTGFGCRIYPGTFDHIQLPGLTITTLGTGYIQQLAECGIELVLTDHGEYAAGAGVWRPVSMIGTWTRT